MALADGTVLRVTVECSSRRVTRGIVLFVHGFAGDQHENGLFDELAARCVDAGLTAVRYDWRGLGQSEGVFESTALEDHCSDLQDVLRWLQADKAKTPRPISVVGFSLGAALTMLCVKLGWQFERLAFLSPAIRPNRCMWPRYDTPDNWNAIKEIGYIEKEGTNVLIGRRMLESLRDTDCESDVCHLEIPTLLVHGTADSRIDCAHTRDLFVRAKRKARLLEFEEVEGASHSFRPGQSYWPTLGDRLASWFTETANARAEAGVLG